MVYITKQQNPFSEYIKLFNLKILVIEIIFIILMSFKLRAGGGVGNILCFSGKLFSNFSYEICLDVCCLI